MHAFRQPGVRELSINWELLGENKIKPLSGFKITNMKWKLRADERERRQSGSARKIDFESELQELHVFSKVSDIALHQNVSFQGIYIRKIFCKV